MRLRLFDILGIATVLMWLAWIGYAVTAPEEGLADVEQLELTEEDRKNGWRDGIEWQGIYLKDQKVGYIKLKKWREGDKYHMDSDMVLHLTVMRTRQKIATKTKAVLDKSMTLERFDLNIKSGPADMLMRGRVNGNVVTLEIDSGGDVQTQKVTLKEPPRLNHSLKPLLLRGEMKEGDRTSMSFFDPGSMTERRLVFTYKGREEIMIMEQVINAHVFTQEMDGIRMQVWLNDIGEVLQEDLPMGLQGVREAGVEARYGVVSGTVSPAEDVIDAVSVKPIGKVFPIASKRVKVRLKGLSFKGLKMDGGRQSWAPAEDEQSGVLTMSIEALEGQDWTIGQLGDPSAAVPNDPELAKELAASVKAEPMIQSDNERIRSRTLRLLGAMPNETGPLKILDASRKISKWVYDEVDKRSVIGVPSALETLDNLQGDCNEHTTLAVAMMRSVGIPARPAVGIAYLPDRGRFFYHAWVEIWAGGWIAVDPTFGQFPADIGHVRFVTGGLSEQVEMFRVIGQLALEPLY